MAEEESRTGDPNKDAPPASRASWQFTWGCLGLALIFALIVAFIYGANYS